MGVPQNFVRLDIHPGEWYVGARYHSLYTVLGSCVSLTAWHPQLKIGGMCHFILPKLPGGLKDKKINAGRYANTALELIKKALLVHAPLSEFKFGVYGGSDTISHFGVGRKNSDFAQRWLIQENLHASRVDVGGNISRTLTFTINSGVIVVKHHNMPITDAFPVSINAKRL
ncbi:MAG TPA: chemotaxis protein CheD [Cellvibrionaceae bacterium]